MGLQGFRRDIWQKKDTNAAGSDADETKFSLFASPLCKSLLFGLVTSFILIGFYLYTGLASLARLSEQDCDFDCQLDATDDLIRKFIGICATSCQIGALIVIIHDLDNLDPILILRQEVREFEDAKKSIERLDKIVESGAKENIALEEVLQEINARIGTNANDGTGAFCQESCESEKPPSRSVPRIITAVEGTRHVRTISQRIKQHVAGGRAFAPN